MTKHITTTEAIVYESPVCDIININTEGGVLCSSFETPEEYNTPYQW